jgi:hypothetical protein
MFRESHLILVAVATILHCSDGGYYIQGLEAKLADAELPTNLCQSKAVYDGTDYVYIFGGLARYYVDHYIM